MTKSDKAIIRIIACRVFKPAIEHLRLESSYPNIRMTFLPPNLHLRPQELSKYMRKEIVAAKRRKERIICLYGDCFPGISDYCQRHGARRLPGSNCWEMLLGTGCYSSLLEESAGTYFLEKELIFNFEEYCVEPLELYDKEMRDQCFKHYQRLLYVRQPSDQDLLPKTSELAQFLGLSLDVKDADYSHLEKDLTKLLDGEYRVKVPRTLNQKNKEKTGHSTHKERRPRQIWLHVFPKDIWIPARAGATILEALREASVELNGDCGGLGKCGKCKFKVLSVVRPPTKIERALLNEKELGEGIRLACRTMANRDLAIYVGELQAEPDYFKILTTSHVHDIEYIPVSQLEPLVERRLITLSPAEQDKGHSDLDRVKQGLGLEYSDLTASLYCLQTLPETLKETQSEGQAVLHEHCLIGWRNQKKDNQGYGIVFDIGTSTVVGKLINLSDGSEAAVASCLNSQSSYGSDVISRLHYVKQNPGGLETLHHFMMKDLNDITRRVLGTAGVNSDEIFIAVVAGNTTMQHFLLNLSPAGIAEAPFSPVVTDGMIVNAADIGLELNPAALLYTIPMKSGYIGGDLISFVLESGVTEQKDEIILGLDLGTNGEIFLGNGKRLLTCSAAAGPALEGARISSGMIAKAGAIEGVRHEEGVLHYRTIGNIHPKGICGSGLVDLVAVLLHCGVIDPEGLIRLSPQKRYKEMNSRVIPQKDGYSFLVASEEESFYGHAIYLTQKDVRELQLAKAAIAAGIKILMDELSMGTEDISQVYLAGALGNYVDRISTLRIGLIPDVKIERIKSLGNAASVGASKVLLSRKHWQMAKDVTKFMEHIELSYRGDFNQYFIEQMDFRAKDYW